eukprot:6030254-Lingulodinium_polyedra.AAC.1
MAEAGESVRRSVRQRIYEVARCKAEKDKELGHHIVPERITVEYAKEMQYARKRRGSPRGSST